MAGSASLPLVSRTSNPSSTPAVGLRDPAFLGVLGTAFAVALGFGLVVPALPTFARILGASYTATSAVVAVFAGVRLVSSAPAGSLVDRIGARRVVVAGLLVVAASTGATAEAQTYWQLVTLRGLGGVGSAMFITGIGQHIVVTVPRQERGRAFGLLQGSFLLGGASGPAVGGLVIDAFGIRAPFWTYAVTLLLATAVALRFLHPSRHATGAGGDAEAPPEAPDDPEGSNAPAAPGLPRLGALGTVLRDRTFWIALLLALAVNWATQGMRFFGVPVFGDEALGLSGGQVGLALTVASVAHGVILWPASRWTDSAGRRWPARIGAALYAFGVLGLLTVDQFGGLLAWMAVQGLATGMVAAVPSAVVGDLVPHDVAGRGVGILGVARDIGAVVGVQASGILADRFGFDPVFGVTAALLGIAFVGTLAMRETLESEA